MGVCFSTPGAFDAAVPNNRDRLDRSTDENTDWYSLKGLSTEAKVLRVYDGDTIIVAFIHNDEPKKKKIRLFGIDAPELRPRRTNVDRLDEKKAAQIVTDRVKQLCLGKYVMIEGHGEDSFGRLLATVRLPHHNNRDLSDLLFDEGLARPYSQSIEKESFTTWWNKAAVRRQLHVQRDNEQQSQSRQ